VSEIGIAMATKHGMDEIEARRGTVKEARRCGWEVRTKRCSHADEKFRRGGQDRRRGATTHKSEFNSKTGGTEFRRTAFVVDYDRWWRSSRSGIVCANGINDRLNGAVRGSLRGLTAVRFYGWTSFEFTSVLKSKLP